VCVCVCVCVCARTCVHACVHACVQLIVVCLGIIVGVVKMACFQLLNNRSSICDVYSQQLMQMYRVRCAKITSFMEILLTLCTLVLHPFNGLFSRSTCVSQHQKGRTILDFNEAGDDGVAVALAGPCAPFS